MAGIWFRLRVEWRTRWKAAVALGLLAGLAGAVTLAAVAGVRRTQTAFDRFHEASRGWDVLVNPDEGAGSALDSTTVARLPEVADAARMNAYPVVNVRATSPADIFGTVVMASDGHALYSTSRLKMLRGRMPDRRRPDEVAVDRSFVRRYGLDVGDIWRPAVFTANAPLSDPTPAQLREISRGEHPGWAHLLRLRITGVGVDQASIVLDQGFDNATAILTPAFVRKYRPPLMFWGMFVRLRPGADVGAFQRHVEALVPNESVAFQTLANTRAKVQRGVRPQAGALTIFAIVVALTGLLVIGQTLVRQTHLDGIDHATLGSLGMTRPQLFVLAIGRILPAALVAGVVAVAGAFALSPLMPIGIARVAEPHPGFDFDARILLGGALVLAAVVMALVIVPAWRATRRTTPSPAPHGSRIAVALGRAGAPPVPAAGVRFALEPGRGSTAVPVRTTIGSAFIAVAAVTAAVVVAASLGHLVDTPRLFGWTWDASVEIGGNDPAQARATQAAAGHALDRDRDVADWSWFSLSSVELKGRPIPAVGRVPSRPAPGFVVAAGRLPRTDHEIALGIRTMHDLGVGIGGHVAAKDRRGRSVPLTVVGQSVLPGLGTYSGSDKTAPGEGALLTAAGLSRVGPPFEANRIVIGLRPGLDAAARTAALRRIARLSPDPSGLVVRVQEPSDVVAWGDIKSTPVMLALVLALLATMTLAHGLITSVRRRRRELALLKTLGFTRRQVTGTVAWQASTVAAIAVLLGVPLGIVVGRWAWSVLVDDLGTIAESVVPWVVLAVGVPVLLVVANVVAFIPGRVASRLRPATVLRSE
jgi:hypothetical protein